MDSSGILSLSPVLNCISTDDSMPLSKRLKTEVMTLNPLNHPHLRDTIFEYYNDPKRPLVSDLEPHDCRRYERLYGYKCVHPSKDFQSKFPWTWSYYYPGKHNVWINKRGGYLYLRPEDYSRLTHGMVAYMDACF